jgi:heat shock protein HslJ
VSVPRSLRFGALVALLLAVFAGCSSSDSDGSGSSTTKPAGEQLSATGWVLDQSTDLGVAHSAVAVTAEFGGGRIRGNSGCNDYTGPYRVSGTKLTIGPDIASTRMACEAGPTAVAAAYLKRLPKVESFAIDATSLTLSGSNGEPLLVYRASTTTDTLSGEWDATSIYTGTAVQSVLAGSPPTARFDRGQVTGDSSCNNFSGSYEVNGNVITMGPFSSTMMACVDPARQTQEQQYLAALELAKTFRITGNRLELERADGGIAVAFERGSATG